MQLFEFRWQCNRCNACCTSLASGVPLLLSDVRRMANRMEISEQEFIAQYCDYIEERDEENGVVIPLLMLCINERECVLFSGTGCSVHEYKPYYCKASPFISMMFSDKRLGTAFKEKCEGFGKGKLHTIDEIKRHLKEEQQLEYADVLEYQKQILNI